LDSCKVFLLTSWHCESDGAIRTHLPIWHLNLYEGSLVCLLSLEILKDKTQACCSCWLHCLKSMGATAKLVITSSSWNETLISSCSGSFYLLSWQGLWKAGWLSFSLEFKWWKYIKTPKNQAVVPSSLDSQGRDSAFLYMSWVRSSCCPENKANTWRKFLWGWEVMLPVVDVDIFCHSAQLYFCASLDRRKPCWNGNTELYCSPGANSSICCVYITLSKAGVTWYSGNIRNWTIGHLFLTWLKHSSAMWL